jgi:hypothetical protein
MTTIDDPSQEQALAAAAIQGDDEAFGRPQSISVPPST